MGIYRHDYLMLGYQIDRLIDNDGDKIVDIWQIEELLPWRKIMEKEIKEIKIHEHGYIKLIDYLGDDKRVCDSARLSFGNDKKVTSLEEDKNLIDYLWRNKHCSPFEQVDFVFELKMPIFVARQMVRHRTAKLNEISGRYTELPEEFFVPDTFNLQSKSNKQGRKEDIVTDNELWINNYKNNMQESFKLYHEAVEAGVAKELARINLPLSTYTQWVWKIDLRNLLNLLWLRTDSHAQKEIRDYADAMLELIKPIVPFCVDAWERHDKYGVHLSRDEVEAFKTILNMNIGPSQTNILLDSLGERGARILLEKFGLK